MAKKPLIAVLGADDAAVNAEVLRLRKMGAGARGVIERFWHDAPEQCATSWQVVAATKDEADELKARVVAAYEAANLEAPDVKLPAIEKQAEGKAKRGRKPKADSAAEDDDGDTTNDGTPPPDPGDASE